MRIAGMRINHHHRVLTPEQAQSLSPDQLRWFRALGYFLPMAGAEEPGEGEGGAGAGSGGEGSGGSGGAEGEGGEGAGAGSSEDDDDDEDEDDDDKDGKGGKDRLELSRSEYERLKRIAREHDQATKKRQQEEKRQQERLRKEQGQYEELLREKDEQIASVEAERDEARYQLDAFRRRVRVTDAAKRLGYKDPEDAFRFLSDEDSEDDTSTERALKRLAKSKPYLVAERRSTGAPVNGDGVTLTMDQIKNMSQSEINARWEEVQKAMASAS